MRCCGADGPPSLELGGDLRELLLRREVTHERGLQHVDALLDALAARRLDSERRPMASSTDQSGEEDDDPDQLEVEFNTAWSPPEAICSALREQYPDVSISWFYDEPGCEIAGYL